MSIVITPSQVVSPTAQASVAPFRTTFLSFITGETATGSAKNRVVMPNQLTRDVMAETETGINVVNCANIDDLFDQLDS